MLSKRFQISQLILNIVLVGVLVGVLISGRESTIVNAAEPRAETASAVPGGPGYVMVPATAFIPESPNAGYSIFWGELSVPNGSPNGYTIFDAPVYLPQGAQLTGITLYYRDTNADGYTLGVDFLRKLLPSASSGENVGLSVYSNLTGLFINQSDTTPEPSRAIVDNSQYAYWLSLYVYAAPTYLQLQAVRIDYTYNVSLSNVLR